MGKRSILPLSVGGAHQSVSSFLLVFLIFVRTGPNVIHPAHDSPFFPFPLLLLLSPMHATAVAAVSAPTTTTTLACRRAPPHARPYSSLSLSHDHLSHSLRTSSCTCVGVVCRRGH